MNELWNVCIEWNVVFCQFTIDPLSSNRSDCVCPKLKMSSESYCCYLVCCSFDSLLEQPVSCSLLEQPDQLYSVGTASQLYCWNSQSVVVCWNSQSVVVCWNSQVSWSYWTSQQVNWNYQSSQSSQSSVESPLPCYDVVPSSLYPDMFFNKDCPTHKPRLCGIGGSYNVCILKKLWLNILTATLIA